MKSSARVSGFLPTVCIQTLAVMMLAHCFPSSVFLQHHPRRGEGSAGGTQSDGDEEAGERGLGFRGIGRGAPQSKYSRCLSEDMSLLLLQLERHHLNWHVYVF